MVGSAGCSRMLQTEILKKKTEQILSVKKCGRRSRPRAKSMDTDRSNEDSSLYTAVRYRRIFFKYSKVKPDNRGSFETNAMYTNCANIFCMN